MYIFVFYVKSKCWGVHYGVHIFGIYEKRIRRIYLWSLFVYTKYTQVCCFVFRSEDWTPLRKEGSMKEWQQRPRDLLFCPCNLEILDKPKYGPCRVETLIKPPVEKSRRKEMEEKWSRSSVPRLPEKSFVTLLVELKKKLVSNRWHGKWPENPWL